MNNPYTNRLWQSSGGSPNFDWNWYTGDNEGAAGSQVRDEFNKWLNPVEQNIHFGDYVRANPDLEAGFRNESHALHNTYPDRWALGQWHFKNHGINEMLPEGVGRPAPRILPGSSLDRNTMNTLMTRLNSGASDGTMGADNKSAFARYAQHHFETGGRAAGYFGSKSDWYDSIPQQEIRDEEVAAQLNYNAGLDRQLQERLAGETAAAKKLSDDAVQASMKKAAEGAEYGRLASRRGGGNRTLGASGAASFKGKGLKTSANKRGKGRGTAQLRRPYERSSLSIASMAKGNNPSTLNL